MTFRGIFGAALTFAGSLLHALDGSEYKPYAKLRPVACSNCFQNHGLQGTAFRLGKESAEACPSCGSTTGRKLDWEALNEACRTFFVRGSIPTGHGIFAPLVQVNDTHGVSDKFGTAELNADIKRLEEKQRIFCFYYGPPLWMFPASTHRRDCGRR